MNAYKTIITFAGTLLILSTSACGIGGNYVPANSLSTSVESFKLVSPTNILAVGNKLKITPVILQANGQLPTNPAIEWKVSDDKLATIEKDGTITALADGNVVITGKYNGKEATTTLSLSKLPPSGNDDFKDPKGTTIQANPALLSLIKNIVIKTSEQSAPSADYNIDSIEKPTPFQVVAYDENNKPLSGITFSWSSSNETVAKVTSKGVVTAYASGSSNIIATAGDKVSNIARVIVLNGKANINVNFQGD